MAELTVPKPAGRAPALREHYPRPRRAFTLVELLIVIAIIGTLIGLLLPAVNSARESGRRTQCLNNLRQIALGLQTYHEANNSLPNGANFGASWSAATWAALILPEIGQDPVYQMFNFNTYAWDPSNVPAVQVVIPTFICPSDGSASTALMGGRIQAGNGNPGKSMGLWYPGSMGPTRDGTAPGNSCVFCPQSPPCYCCAATADYGQGEPGPIGVGIFDRGPHPTNFASVTDGLSNTLMLGETIPSQCTFNGAYNNNFPIAGTTIPVNTFQTTVEDVNTLWWTGCGFKSRHPGACNFALCDGSVRTFSDSIDYQLYNGLGTRAGGEAVQVPQ